MMTNDEAIFLLIGTMHWCADILVREESVSLSDYMMDGPKMLDWVRESVEDHRRSIEREDEKTCRDEGGFDEQLELFCSECGRERQ